MVNLILKVILVTYLFLANAFAENLKNIEISGNKRISDQTIKIFSDIEINNEINNSILDKVLKNLYKTNFFKNVNLSFENQILYINVEENPIVEDLQITGVKNKSLLEFLTDNINLANMKSFDQEILASDLDVIDNILKTNGYYFNKISSSKSFNDDLNTVKIKINIELGDKAKIKKIVFLGDKVFKDKRLKEVIASEEHKFWKFISKNVYINQEIIKLDKRLLTNYFKDNGYYNVKVDNSFVEFDKKGNFNLIFNITSGKKFFF
ncbi:outer membrane protein assembly factor BamA, partial [Pelagibacterales bacterium SAG-MED13]|nr:outer membrane protein assembly factor BamA [Pelagibacterales bacterium SAG-MED13]